MRTLVALLAWAVVAQALPADRARFLDPKQGANAEALVARALAWRRALLSASQPLVETSTRIRPADARDPASIERRQADLDDAERRLAADVRRTYVAAVAAARKLRAIADALDLARETHRLTRARVEHGRAPWRVEAELFVEVSRIDVRRLAAEREAELAMLELKKIIGVAPEEPLRLKGEDGIDRPVPPEAEGLARAIRSRAPLLAARAAATPGTGDVEEAREPSRIHRQHAELAVRHEVRAAYLRVDKARQALEVFRRDILDEALANVEVVRKVHELDGQSVLEYLAHEKQFAELEMQYADVWKEHMDALVELDYLIGG